MIHVNLHRNISYKSLHYTKLCIAYKQLRILCTPRIFHIAESHFESSKHGPLC